MNKKRYIKVTPKDSKKSIVLLASNADFYKSQGAKIEEPTEDEIYEFFPELKKQAEPEKPAGTDTSEADALKAENEQLKAATDAVIAENEQLKAENATLKAEIEALKAPKASKASKKDEE